MSRFDLFFVVLDDCDSEVDKMIADHIINRRRGLEEWGCEGDMRDREEAGPLYSTQQVQEYIEFARHFTPRRCCV